MLLTIFNVDELFTLRLCLTYILPATFPIGTPSLNSFILFKKLCPILAAAPRTLANASIPLEMRNE